jgi:hypothetical protein
MPGEVSSCSRVLMVGGILGAGPRQGVSLALTQSSTLGSSIKIYQLQTQDANPKAYHTSNYRVMQAGKIDCRELHKFLGMDIRTIRGKNASLLWKK